MNTDKIRGQKASGQAQKSGPDFHKNWNLEASRNKE